MRILSIDGGGIRGLIPAMVLAELERRTEQRTADLFDFVAGTSTGAIVAAALTRPDAGGRPRYTAAELVGLYETEGPKIFSRTLIKRIRSGEGWIDERYDDDGLNAALATYLGDAHLSQALSDLFLTAYDIERRAAYFFRSSRARAGPDDDFRLSDAVRASTAAPTYFEPALVHDLGGGREYALVDGGVFAVNPSMCAYADVRRAGQADQIAVVASLGTGSHTRPLSYDVVRSWGMLEWARPILDVVFDGVADTIEFELRQLLAPERYFRFQIDLREASDALDDASPANLAALRREAERLIRERSADLDRLAAAVGSPAAGVS
jgi:patatin-like phospholipase/acyl hydrolase